MKNYTGTTLQWKAKNYPPMADVPQEVADEMQLATFPDQVRGQEAQSGSPPPPITDPYDPIAIASLEMVSPPMVLLEPGAIAPTMQSAPDVSYGQIVDLGAVVVPPHLKPPEEKPTEQPPQSPPIEDPLDTSPPSVQEEEEAPSEEDEQEPTETPARTTTTRRTRQQ